jgi:6,7-dimethyl-8-ribityllumazine synthase
MATKFKNLSDHQAVDIPSASLLNIGIVVSEWNPAITGSLLTAALETLYKYGVLSEHIKVRFVPGSFELRVDAAMMLETYELNAVICLGCVIQGETRHFEFICQAVSQGIMQLSLEHKIPVVFGLLTTDTLEQAKDRSGGKHGNKGTEAAVTALKMASLSIQMKDPTVA